MQNSNLNTANFRQDLSLLKK
jgi:hypothetical protein